MEVRGRRPRSSRHGDVGRPAGASSRARRGCRRGHAAARRGRARRAARRREPQLEDLVAVVARSSSGMKKPRFGRLTRRPRRTSASAAARKRVAGDVVLGGELLLAQMLAGREPAGEDELLQPGGECFDGGDGRESVICWIVEQSWSVCCNSLVAGPCHTGTSRTTGSRRNAAAARDTSAARDGSAPRGTRAPRPVRHEAIRVVVHLLERRPRRNRPRRVPTRETCVSTGTSGSP